MENLTTLSSSSSSSESGVATIKECGRPEPGPAVSDDFESRCHQPRPPEQTGPAELDAPTWSLSESGQEEIIDGFCFLTFKNESDLKVIEL